jgi:hypothetical protein
MTDQLPPQPVSEPEDKPARLEYLAGPDEAGDSACWAQFVCPECGAMLSEDACHCEAREAGGDPASPECR